MPIVLDNQITLILIISLAFFNVGLLIWNIVLSRKVKLSDDKCLDLQSKIDGLSQKSTQMHIELVLKQSKLEAAELKIQELSSENAQLKVIKEEYLRVQSQYQSLKDTHQAEREIINETKERLFKEIELSATKLFDTKKERFEAANIQNMHSLLNPLKDQISEFNKKIAQSHALESSQRNQLMGQIIELQKQTHHVSEEANNLASALKNDNKVQGRWGETILERLLELSGLQKGREYVTQKSLRDTDSRQLKPDVLVHLPDERDIVIDSKVSLIAFERYISCENNNDMALYLKEHIQSIRKHIKTLSDKSYESLDGIKSLEFTLMFIPIDQAMSVAINQDQSLFSYAYSQKIILVSPSSLLVSLKTIESLWQINKQNIHAKHIADGAGKLHDQFALFYQSYDEVGKALDKASSSFDKGRSRLMTGRGSVFKKVLQLKELGAKTTRNIDSVGSSTLKVSSDEVLSSDETSMSDIDNIDNGKQV